MNILIACEFSGTVREAFKKRGHYVLSCDLLKSNIPGNHYIGDVKDVLYDKWDMLIGFPPCTYICNSGVSHLHKDKSRWLKMIVGALFFKDLLTANIPKICIENPIPHKYALRHIEQKYTQIIQPYQFGHLEQKSTCLWLKGLPLLKETNNVKSAMLNLPKKLSQANHYIRPGKDRGLLRSITYSGIAEAMANQWG
jgi:hypothetical protein